MSFVPSQIAQPEGGTIVTLSSAPRLTAEGGGNQAITVRAVVSKAFAGVVVIMTSAHELHKSSMPVPDLGRCDGYHRIVDYSRARPREIPRRSPTALVAHSCPAPIGMLRLRP